MIKPVEQAILFKIATGERHLTIGIPSSANTPEHRVGLTPEGVDQLTAKGYKVIIEKGVGQMIHYDDEAYARAGGIMASRREAFGADIVVYMGSPSGDDAANVRPGAFMLTLLDNRGPGDIRGLYRLLERRVTLVALNRVADAYGHRPIADILGEIDGRAAMTLAAGLLADAQVGKGILLGGVAGINPCEVTILGSGMSAIAASRSAMGLGAVVRMFSADQYALRHATEELGPGVITSSVQPRVMLSALRTADVVLATRDPGIIFEENAVEVMKRGVVVFDLGACGGVSHVFPTMPTVDLAASRPAPQLMTSGRRQCFTNPAGAVARTAAMALSNELVPFIDLLLARGTNIGHMLRDNANIRQAVCMYNGQATDASLAIKMRVKTVDINLLLAFL